jgi:hypothetical protein
LRAATVRHGPVTVPVDGEPALARVLTYLPGGTLTGAGYLSPRVVAGLGTVAGQVSRALRPFRHPGLDRVLQWDLRHADRVIGVLAGHVRDAGLRARVTDAATAAWDRVQALAGGLPVQTVHGDVTDDNVVCTTRRGLRTPDGVIDFGDLTSSWAVGELAVAITSVLRHAGAEPCLRSRCTMPAAWIAVSASASPVARPYSIPGSSGPWAAAYSDSDGPSGSGWLRSARRKSQPAISPTASRAPGSGFVQPCSPPVMKAVVSPASAGGCCGVCVVCGAERIGPGRGAGQS